MKKKLILFLGLMVTATAAQADIIYKPTYVTKEFNKYVNETTINEYQGRNNPVGWGSDIPLIITDKWDVDAEIRTDTQNKNDNGDWETSIFVVSKPKWEKGLLQHIWGFLFGWLKKDEVTEDFKVVQAPYYWESEDDCKDSETGRYVDQTLCPDK